jgi:threonine dehydrogenase-like Zn-dependent dehydrogenase
MKINRIVNEGFMKTMLAAYLPGNSTVDLREVAVPTPGINQVLIKMKSSGICGSDVHYIYHQHRATAAAPDKPLYQGFINGHEPCGQIVAMGQGCRHFKEGDRVLVYHISGCGFCPNCRRGFPISCTGKGKAAYGWQRDGGHAEYLLAEEKDLILLPDALSYEDGAFISCGVGTAYEGILRYASKGSPVSCICFPMSDIFLMNDLHSRNPCCWKIPRSYSRCYPLTGGRKTMFICIPV